MWKYFAVLGVLIGAQLSCASNSHAAKDEIYIENATAAEVQEVIDTSAKKLDKKTREELKRLALESPEIVFSEQDAILRATPEEIVRTAENNSLMQVSQSNISALKDEVGANSAAIDKKLENNQKGCLTRKE